MIVNIPTNKELVFSQYLTIINGLLSNEKRLRKSELEVLSKMLYIDNMYAHLNKDKRDIILFHRSTKERIRKSLLNMSEGSYNNIMKDLRKKGFIKDKSLSVEVPIINNRIKLEFNLIINDSKEDTERIKINS